MDNDPTLALAGLLEDQQARQGAVRWDPRNPRARDLVVARTAAGLRTLDSVYRACAQLHLIPTLARDEETGELLAVATNWHNADQRGTVPVPMAKRDAVCPAPEAVARGWAAAAVLAKTPAAEEKPAKKAAPPKGAKTEEEAPT